LQVLAFGRNNRGQLGVGDMDHHGEPSLVTKLCGMDIVQVECGSKHTIVLTKKNELFAIGRNTEGQLGMGEVEQQPEPKAVDAAGWIPRSGHLSVGGFSAHNFFVPVPRMEERRSYGALFCRVAFCGRVAAQANFAGLTFGEIWRSGGAGPRAEDRDGDGIASADWRREHR